MNGNYVTVGRRRYTVVERYRGGKRIKVRDPEGGAKGAMRLIHILPDNAATEQFVRVLERMEQNDSFPTVLQFSKGQGVVKVVTTWAAGRSLRDHLREPRGRGETLTAFTASQLFHRLAHGVSALSHHKNVVHGDIHPDNLVLAREPNRLILIDFGSAWTIERTQRRVEGDGKSDIYAAPELFEDAGLVDFRSDQFSVSMVGYEMFTGKIPYDGIGGQAGLAANVGVYANTYEPASAVSPLRGQMPRRFWKAIDRVLERGLRLDPAARYSNRSDWLDAIADIRFERERVTRGGIIERGILNVIDWIQGTRPPR